MLRPCLAPYRVPLARSPWHWNTPAAQPGNGHTASLASPLVQDHARAWTAARGRCHRFVYDPDGKPSQLPGTPGDHGLAPGRPGPLVPVGACAGQLSAPEPAWPPSAPPRVSPRAAGLGPCPAPATECDPDEGLQRVR